jgi:hypothetical protein
MASRRGARAREARRGGGRGGVAAERPVDAAARPTNSGEVTGGDERRGIDTNGTGTTLTSWRSSIRAPRRRCGDDGEDPRRRRGLGFRARCGARGGGSGVSSRASRGRRRAINSPGGRLGVRATHGDACPGWTRAAAAESGAGTVAAEGMMRGPHPSAAQGVGCGYSAGGPAVLGRAAVGPDARLRRAGPRRGAGCWVARRPRRVRWPAGLVLLSGLDRMGWAEKRKG